MMRRLFEYLKSDYERKTFIFAFVSAFISFAYASYNGVLGIIQKSIWNGSICIYYLLLLLIKTILIVERERAFNEKRRKTIIFISFILLIIITSAMFVPAILLIKNERAYDLGLIPAIAMAAYTTYSVTNSIINFSKAKYNDNQLVKQIITINIVSSLMSIIVLQNTLILANGELDKGMKTLSICSTFAIISSILILIFIQVRKYVQYISQSNSNERFQ